MGKIANKENFVEILKMNPRILHVSCHGELDVDNKSSCLVLEE